MLTSSYRTNAHLVGEGEVSDDDVIELTNIKDYFSHPHENPTLHLRHPYTYVVYMMRALYTKKK